ncbi:hypothetical protein C0J52_02697 [Blattella germanica]|nr:hypothetical protein C0J52_02697 [Blattella germanica]
MSSRKRSFVVHSEVRQLNIEYSVNYILVHLINVFSLRNTIVLSPPLTALLPLTLP